MSRELKTTAQSNKKNKSVSNIKLCLCVVSGARGLLEYPQLHIVGIRLLVFMA